MRLLSTPQAKAERKRLESAHQDYLQTRHEKGDNSLRHTIFGNIKHKRTGGILIKSAEVVRFAYAATPLPRAIGETAILNEIDQLVVDNEIPTQEEKITVSIPEQSQQ